MVRHRFFVLRVCVCVALFCPFPSFSIFSAYALLAVSVWCLRVVEASAAALRLFSSCVRLDGSLGRARGGVGVTLPRFPRWLVFSRVLCPLLRAPRPSSCFPTCPCLPSPPPPRSTLRGMYSFLFLSLSVSSTRAYADAGLSALVGSTMPRALLLSRPLVSHVFCSARPNWWSLLCAGGPCSGCTRLPFSLPPCAYSSSSFFVFPRSPSRLSPALFAFATPCAPSFLSLCVCLAASPRTPLLLCAPSGCGSNERRRGGGGVRDEKIFSRACVSRRGGPPSACPSTRLLLFFSSSLPLPPSFVSPRRPCSRLFPCVSGLPPFELFSCLGFPFFFLFSPATPLTSFSMLVHLFGLRMGGACDAPQLQSACLADPSEGGTVHWLRRIR